MKLLRILSTLFVFSFCLPLHAKEYGGKWTDKSKAEVSWKLIEHLKTEQEERLEKLKEYVPDLTPTLSFSNFPSETGRDGERTKEKFLEGRLSSKATAEFMGGLHQNLQANQNLLYPAEKLAFKKWQPKPGDSKESTKTHTAKILGNEVTAIRLGVILDNSPSMREVVETLRKEITQKFSYSYFVEVAGTKLSPRQQFGSLLARRSSVGGKDVKYGIQDSSWFFADPPKHLNPFDPKWHSPQSLGCLKSIETCYPEWPRITRDPISALLAMINLLETDTIYWFSDYEDDVDEKFLLTLIREMQEKKIRLYLVSNSRKPHKLLMKYAEYSGGSYKKERVR